jgi:phosphonate transport system permease protein
MSAAVPRRRWRPPPVLFPSRTWRWLVYAGALVYLLLAVGSLEVNWLRIYEGAERGWRFIQGFLAPDFTRRWRDIVLGFQESLTMTVTSTVVGVLISIPIGIGAARNLAPAPVYYSAGPSSPSPARSRRSSSPSCSSPCSASGRSRAS